MMNSILLFAGTTEGRRIAQALKNQPVSVTVSVATEYGETLIEPAGNICVLHGRKDAAATEALLKETGAALLIDATHPYAVAVTKMLKTVAGKTGVEYLRVLRQSELSDADGCVFVRDTDEAVAYLNVYEGDALLTVGSKELARYTAVRDWDKRLYARVLPVRESIDAALALGFTGKRLICMQGPFSEELNRAVLTSLSVRYLVTKDTGAAGGFPEKIAAARACGVTPIVVRRPAEEQGTDVRGCIELLKNRFGIAGEPQKNVTVLGIGAQGEGTLTIDAVRALEQAELIIGAKRVIDALKRFRKPAIEAIAPGEIADAVRSAAASRIVVAMSGDTGFFSGTKGLLPLIADCKPVVLPGISSVAYLAARLRSSYQDAALASAHGRAANVIALVRQNPRLYLLTGGKPDAASILSELTEYGLSDVRITVGERLGYPDERITTGTAMELCGASFDPLTVLYIENPAAKDVCTHGRDDGDFLRSDVPMTKSEVRAVTLSKLKLTRDAVCWDVGAGTGSVSVEMAEIADRGTVYAIERSAEACALIEQNKRHLGVSNITVVAGSAPQALTDLPAPTHVFVGGSGGNLKEILTAALQKNPRVRIVLNTVTAETFAEALDAGKTLPVRQFDIVEISVSRASKVGPYHMMRAQNPVTIISMEGSDA